MDTKQIKNYFDTNNKTIKNYLKNFWKILLFFTLFYILLNVLIFTFQMLTEKPNTVLFLSNFDYSYNNNSDGGIGIGILFSVKWILLSFPSVFFFSILIIMLINKAFVSEIKTGKINFWLSLPLAKSEILLSRLSFLISSVLIVFSPSFLLTIILSTIAKDANQYFGYMFLYELEFILFLITLTSFYFFISIIIKNSTLYNIACSLFILYIFIIWLVNIIYSLDIIKNKNINNLLKIFQYFTPLILITSPYDAEITRIATGKIMHIKNYTIQMYPVVFPKINKILVSISFISMPLLSFLMMFAKIKYFEKHYTLFKG